MGSPLPVTVLSGFLGAGRTRVERELGAGTDSWKQFPDLFPQWIGEAEEADV